MRFTKHYELEGQHAFLGASKYHWINYDVDKMKNIWRNQFKSMRGSQLHALAMTLIKNKVKLPKNNLTLNAYVNDAIGFRMTPEVVLKFSDNSFGTADAISFDEERKQLRVHDLKTGVHPGNFKQLMVYCAMFCAEYGKNPYDIVMIMRIYQSDSMIEQYANPDDIKQIIDQMTLFEPEIEKLKDEELM